MMRNRISVYVAGLLVIGCAVFLAANFSFAGTVDLPKTGQTTCWDSAGDVILCAGTGQDGDTQAGVAWPLPRFMDNGDGTTTDSLTGLMWLKDASCLGQKTWVEALNTIADFNANPGNYICGGYTAAYNDWGLPNVNELESLFNAEEYDNALWLNTQGFANIQSLYYWSSTTNVDFTDEAWVVHMDEGKVSTGHKSTTTRNLWPVRGGQAQGQPASLWQTGQTTSYAAGDDGDLQRGVSWPVPRFTDNGDGTVTDNLTGLMWVKDASCLGSLIWQDALDTVGDFNMNPGNYSCVGYNAPHKDWRLPNRKELHSLTDYSHYDPSLPPGHPFLCSHWDDYWSSTNYGSRSAWQIYMDSGHMFGSNKSGYYYVWPVRGRQVGPSFDLDIKANGQDGPIIVTASTPVSIDISLDPGAQAGLNAEWWIVVQWPFGMFWQYYSYVYPVGWLPGINRCIEMPLINLGSLNVLTTTLFPGDFEFFFLIDDNVDGIPEGTWVDLVKVIVQ